MYDHRQHWNISITNFIATHHYIIVLCSLECHCSVSSYSYNSILQIVDVMGNKIFQPQNRWCCILFWRKDDSICPYLKNVWESQILANNHSFLFLPGYTVVARCILVWIILFKIDRNTFESFPNIFLPPHSVIWKKNRMNYCLNLS